MVDPFQIVVGILSAVFGAGGVASIVKARGSHKDGLPEHETEARQLAPGLNYLTDYYQKELDTLRGDLRKELAEVKMQVVRLTSEREADADYIDELEQHIWERKAPPPPKRHRTPGGPK